MIKMMLRVNPRVRPDCQKILHFISKYRKNKKSFQQSSVEQTSFNLLNTIKVPKGMINLDSRLPQSNYIKTEPSLPLNNISDIEHLPEEINLNKINLKKSGEKWSKRSSKFNGKNSISHPKILESSEERERGYQLPQINLKNDRSYSYQPRRIESSNRGAAYRKDYYSLDKRSYEKKPNEYSYNDYKSQEAVNDYSRKIQEIINHRNKRNRPGNYHYDNYVKENIPQGVKGPRLRVNRRDYRESGKKRYIYKRPDWWG